jgi:hypothetical protein
MRPAALEAAAKVDPVATSEMTSLKLDTVSDNP